ncbi:hypothetical protein Rumeso_04173 [Rubellimicrobium mesophilum DSM 19309]|uniref:Uncharacterized protein n=1 Tax=Rubellimicrobium mesophilum DSM 19309 TaxID=442562 RepID=A0A017HKK2_9RHOB|nr:hypothetical protein Rumeso_04173 [Rubellimicrobium mesophilum DSM 19309]
MHLSSRSARGPRSGRPVPSPGPPRSQDSRHSRRPGAPAQSQVAPDAGARTLPRPGRPSNLLRLLTPSRRRDRLRGRPRPSHHLWRRGHGPVRARERAPDGARLRRPDPETGGPSGTPPIAKGSPWHGGWTRSFRLSSLARFPSGRA